MAAMAFQDKVAMSINTLTDDLPYFDTEYIFVEAGNNYEIEHNLGVVPKRVVGYIMQNDNPKENKDLIYLYPLGSIEWRDVGGVEKISGNRVRFKNKNTLTLFYEAMDYVFDTWTSGWVRLLIWR